LESGHGGLTGHGVGPDPLPVWVWQWFSGALVVGLPGQIHGQCGSGSDSLVLWLWVCRRGSSVRRCFWVVCLSLFGDLSLFCQNKLSDVSPCGWMLQKTPFYIWTHGRGSL
jgi:hypothetical protein